jgi:HEAT repeat protein
MPHRLFAIGVGALFVLIGSLANLAAQAPSKADLPKFMEGIKSADAKARVAACDGLYKLGQIKSSLIAPAISSLKELIGKDKDTKVRASAAKALGAADPGSEGVKLLIEVVKDEEEETEVRVAACQGLGQIGPDAKEALPAIKMFIADNKDNKKLGKNLKNVVKSISGGK